MAKKKSDSLETQIPEVQSKAPSALSSSSIADILAEEEVVLTDAEGRRYCRTTDCDQISAVDGYCRFHYLHFWKKIQNRKKILADGKLERYIDELTQRYLDKHIEILRKDLRTEKDFLAALKELELHDSEEDENDDEDSEDTKSYIEEIRGIGADDGSSSSSGDDY
jgi:hypothetical protein